MFYREKEIDERTNQTDDDKDCSDNITKGQRTGVHLRKGCQCAVCLLENRCP